MKVTRRDGRNWSMNITAPSDVISKLEQVGKTPEALHEALTKGGLRETIVTNVIVTPTDLATIEAGRGDEVRVHSTDGAWRTGAQLAQELSADALDSLRVILQTPAGIGVNTYKLVPEEGAVDGGNARHANRKQRLMASVESPTCAMKGCNRPADHSQAHHLAAWKNGGRTIAPNLCMLCPFHNGRNDDDPTTFLYGRMVRVKGRLAWQSPFGRLVFCREAPPPGTREPEWRIAASATA